MATDLVTIHLRDYLLVEETIPIMIPSGSTLADITTWAQALSLDVDACSGMEVYKISALVDIPLAGAGYKDPVVIDGVSREIGVAFNMEAGTRQGVPIRLPGVQEDKLGEDDTIVYDADLQALVTQLTTAVNGITACDAGENVLTGVRSYSKSVRRK